MSGEFCGFPQKWYLSPCYVTLVCVRNQSDGGEEGPFWPNLPKKLISAE